MADFFLRPPTLTAGNFEAVQLKDSKFLALKDVYFLKKYDKYQETKYDFRLGFALSNRRHLHRAYLVTVRFHLTLFVVTPSTIVIMHWLVRPRPSSIVVGKI